MEKARLKAEYKEIMNETYENSTRDKRGDKASSFSSSSSSSDTNTNVLTKRKKDLKEEGELMDVGVRVKVKCNGGDLYEGEVIKVKRDKGGNVIKIAVKYDDGDEEECRWPDDDVVVVERELVGEKKNKKKKKDGEAESDGKEMGKIGVERGEVYIDGEGTKMFSCREPGCEYFCNLKRHKTGFHEIDATYYPCAIKGCDYKAKQASSLTTHKANVHDLDVTFYLCGADDCDYKAKEAGNLKSHKAAVHDIDVTYYFCDTNGCEYKAKKASNVKKHKAIVHDIDITYFLCDINGCEYKAKRAADVRSHRSRIHDIV